MSNRASSLLRELARRKDEFGGTAAQRKLRLLQALERLRLSRASEVLRFHEVLCFLRAYPDSGEVLAHVERLLGGFEKRSDLRRHRGALADTGISGTPIHYRFFAATASWLARRWGSRLAIHWEGVDTQDRIEGLLPLVVLYSETPALDEYAFDLREWIRRLKGPEETDAVFLIRRFAQLPMSPPARQVLYDELCLPIRLAPGPDTPSRTRAKFPGLPVSYQTGPLRRSRPSLREEIRRPPRSIRPVPPREGQRLIDLAREAMVTRARDLDVFAYGDRNDVRLVDCGGGLQFACIGVIPERRLLLEAVYGFLTLQNGVPTGYVLCSALFGSSEIAYNVFETFRGGESGHIYGRALAIVRSLFRPDTFTIYPYQLGEDNPEALHSGAWWFYRKMGFLPRDPAVLRILRKELRRMRADPKHRSSLETLKKLAAENLYLHLGPPREDVIGLLPLANVGLRVGRYLADRFGSDRERGAETCSREAARILGVPSLRRFNRNERLIWKRWSPLIRVLPGLERWGREERRAFLEVVRAKAGRRESDFVTLFDRHRRLRAAVKRLAEDDVE